MASYRLKIAVFSMIAAIGLASCAAAAEWPQFLGPQGDGVAHDARGLARVWQAGGPKVLWQQPVSEGYGGAAIFGESVFLLDRDGDKGDLLRRFNLADGKEIWRYAYAAPGCTPGGPDHKGSRSTPATDGNMVFSIGPFGQISAVKFNDGSPVWRRDLLGDWGANSPSWGVTTSPLLYGDCVIVMPWGKKAALAAYEKATGSVRWTTPNPLCVNEEYESPVLAKLDGRDVVLAMGMQGYLIGADAKTGELLWSHQVWPESKEWWDIPSPAAVGDGRIFLTAGYGHGSVMLKVARLTEEESRLPENAGQRYKVTQLWANKQMGSTCAQALLYDGYIYGNSSDVGGGLRCVALDGSLKWDSKGNFELGCLIIADGLIYILNGRTGELSMAEASPAGYRELGRATVLTPPETWAPLAIKDQRLVIRDKHKILCLDLGAGSALMPGR
jgi:outer membrane protein assembly factor BamB